MKKKKSKIIIVAFGRDCRNPDIIHAYTANGGRITVYQAIDYRTDQPILGLFCTPHRRWFHLTYRGKLTEIEHDFSPARRIPGKHCHNGERGNGYPKMRQFGNADCHKIICATFHGSRYLNGVKRECHHIKPDVYNYSADNVIWLDPKEHRRYDAVQRSLRMSGRLDRLTPAQILEVTKHYVIDPRSTDDIMLAEE